jgi:hypothetical protein
MPTIIRVKGYRLYFVSFDGSEPIHVHVRKDNQNAKVWIDSMAFAWSQFKAHENPDVLRIVLENERLIREKWYEHFTV